jgi:hypothetical protein
MKEETMSFNKMTNRIRLMIKMCVKNASDKCSQGLIFKRYIEDPIRRSRVVRQARRIISLGPPYYQVYNHWRLQLDFQGQCVEVVIGLMKGLRPRIITNIDIDDSVSENLRDQVLMIINESAGRSRGIVKTTQKIGKKSRCALQYLTLGPNVVDPIAYMKRFRSRCINLIEKTADQEMLRTF